MNYNTSLRQLESLLNSETNFITNMANTAAFLKQQHGYFWVGFYSVINEELLLGPFQGPVACTRIEKGKGVCGTVWESKHSILVPDVDKFPGHIACNPFSRSEVVIPLIYKGKCIGVLDADSDKLDDFKPEDVTYLESAIEILIQSSQIIE